MKTEESQLVVYFDEPFWVGVFERRTVGKIEVCKIIFGAEPKDCEIHDFILHKWNSLYFSEPEKDVTNIKKRINPKRLQRAIRQQVKNVGIGTKAQQVLKLQEEKDRAERKKLNRQYKELRSKELLVKHQQKKKEKHKGR